jgi:DNA-binding transcriptional ArsR family regulator
VIDETFAALADATRREVIDLLRARPRRAGELAAELRITPPVLSRHLRVLRHSGLVEEEHGHVRDARVRVYRLRPEKFDEMWNWVTFVRKFWDDVDDAFKEYTERPRGRRRRGSA